MKNRIYLNGLGITNVTNTENFVNIEGYAAHFGQPNLNREIVNADSFSEFFELYNAGKLRPRLNYEHSEQLLGGIDNLEIKDNGLYVQAHLNKNVKIVADTILPLIESNDISSFSTEGFIDWNDVVEYEDGSYYAKSFMLTGVSIVATPADPEAKFSLNSFITEYIQKKKESENQIHKNLKWFKL